MHLTRLPATTRHVALLSQQSGRTADVPVRILRQLWQGFCLESM